MTEKIRPSWQEILSQTKILLEPGQEQALLQTVRASLNLGKSVNEFEMLLDTLNDATNSWLEHADAGIVYSDLLLRVRRFKEALEFIHNRMQHNPDERLLEFQALALLRLQQPAEAYNTINQITSTQNQTGLMWRVKAETMYQLGLVGWQEAFQVASQRLSGRKLGLCLIEWGVALEQELQHAAARDRWAQAITLFEKDRYYQALIIHNLGLSCARELKLEEAETYFATLRSLAQHHSVRMFEARAWSGFGLAWRACGEFARAEHAYKNATRTASEAEDKRQAWVGLGHTYRLAGFPSRALSAIRQALQIDEHRINRVNVDLAAAQYANGDAQAALESLEQTGALRGEDLERQHLLRAEIARVQGDANQALESLQKVRLHSLWAREELQAFPGLGALLKAMQYDIPKPLPRQQRMQVEIQARGGLRVLVNGRKIQLAITSRAAQVLVLLLEHDQQCSILKLIDILFGEQPRNLVRAKGKQISKAVRQLRDALGWEDSVTESDGVYSLNTEQTDWHYDVTQAILNGETITNFLEGVHTNWAIERARILSQKPSVIN
jgi:tetratricopeptide (TPR) repeat protein